MSCTEPSGMVALLHILLLFLGSQTSAYANMDAPEQSADCSHARKERGHKQASHCNLISAPSPRGLHSASSIYHHYSRSSLHNHRAPSPTGSFPEPPSHHISHIAPSAHSPGPLPRSPRKGHHHRYHQARPPLSPPQGRPPLPEPSPPLSPPQGRPPLPVSSPPPSVKGPSSNHSLSAYSPTSPQRPHSTPHKGLYPPSATNGRHPPATLAHGPKALPPPPPTEDCGATVCIPPLTKTPFLSPCGCVLPIQVEIELSVPLYALFPLISVLAAEIANGTILSPNQVEVTGANTDSENTENSIVDVNLVPLDPDFDNMTALLIFQRFWNNELVINSTLFGNYSTIYVHYRGLPPSPSSQNNIVSQNGVNGSHEQPIPVVAVYKKSHRLGNGTITVLALSAAIALVLCVWVAWLVFYHKKVSAPTAEPGLPSTRKKRLGGRSNLSSDLGSSTSLSFTSSMATYTSTARSFTFAELERATQKFRPQNVIGEGGFGRVYYGVVDDGTKVAVKVLTRDDQHGGKEFVAEVEMLSRLHHRNLVKLIGICTEEHNRCLVYELIPNGSVESHLHGVDRATSSLDWKARMKIALGAARGLAYLHEDSNPRVIHRDFKASNILLENDFNPKVSDFGLAKAAPDQGSGHLSTRVMGTFGYVAPEYAMTGHLLVKSDVYSYGVVLLELLSGRKPVDMSQPQGQENLVTWARPLLSSQEGLELLVDPFLQTNFPFDNLVRVASIASMCVQPEVSHRPFMGEVVQALKLVCNDCDVGNNGTCSSNASQGGESLTDSELRGGQRWFDPKAQYTLGSMSFISMDYDSGPSQGGEMTTGTPISASEVLDCSPHFLQQFSKSVGRHNLSGPLWPSRSKRDKYKVRGSQQGSMSEHAALARHFGTGLDIEF